MKAELFSIKGEKEKEIELPSVFTSEVRKDIILKVYESEKEISPYGHDPEAGKKQSASGRIRHIRHKWRSHYGRGMSRIPRKTMWRRGTQFYWIGAEVSGTRGGRRAHGPNPGQFMTINKINKKEKLLALKSAIASTSKEDFVKERYSILKDKKIKKLPIIVESKLSNKSKDINEGIKKILGEMYEIKNRERKVRSGKGKLRGRKYKKPENILLISSNKEEIKNKLFDVKKVKDLKVSDLYPLGRIVIYTHDSLNDIEKIGKVKEKAK